jgi:hypothetical protein
MSAIISWKVGVMECYPQYEQEKDVVFTVHWDCVGSETVNNKTYDGRVYGSTAVTYHSGSEFIPYEQLTENVVLSWVWDSMGESQKSNIESNVQTQIDNFINPPVIVLPLPWTPPIITSQPQNVNVTTGSSATFTVIANSPSTLTYQWFKNDANIEGATNSSYTIENVQTSDEGNYKVTVTSANSSSVTSNTVTLTTFNPVPPPIFSPPSITLQPISQTVIVGDGVAFNVNTDGTQPIAYQWSKDDVTIQGATGNTYIIQTASLTDIGTYKVTASNLVGSVTSDAVTLTVNEPTP